jgi:hypothetical protein
MNGKYKTGMQIANTKKIKLKVCNVFDFGGRNELYSIIPSHVETLERGTNSRTIFFGILAFLFKWGLKKNKCENVVLKKL